MQSNSKLIEWVIIIIIVFGSKRIVALTRRLSVVFSRFLFNIFGQMPGFALFHIQGHCSVQYVTIKFSEYKYNKHISQFVGIVMCY